MGVCIYIVQLKLRVIADVLWKFWEDVLLF